MSARSDADDKTARRLHWVLAGALILPSVFVPFVRHAGYELTRPEVALAAAILAGLGALAGLLTSYLPAPVRAATAGLMLVFQLDFHYSALPGIGTPTVVLSCA